MSMRRYHVVGSLFIDFDGFVQAYGSFAFGESSAWVKSVTTGHIHRPHGQRRRSARGRQRWRRPVFPGHEQRRTRGWQGQVNADAVGLLLKNV
jgi:hypothetical protein